MYIDTVDLRSCIIKSSRGVNLALVISVVEVTGSVFLRGMGGKWGRPYQYIVSHRYYDLGSRIYTLL